MYNIEIYIALVNIYIYNPVWFFYLKILNLLKKYVIE